MTITDKELAQIASHLGSIRGQLEHLNNDPLGAHPDLEGAFDQEIQWLEDMKEVWLREVGSEDDLVQRLEDIVQDAEENARNADREKDRYAHQSVADTVRDLLHDHHKDYECDRCGQPTDRGNICSRCEMILDEAEDL